MAGGDAIGILPDEAIGIGRDVDRAQERVFGQCGQRQVFGKGAAALRCRLTESGQNDRGARLGNGGGKGGILRRGGMGREIDVEGDLLVPEFLLTELKAYAYATRRLHRESKASTAHRAVLFLTKNGNPYTQATVARLITDLRRSTLAAGLRFMERFKFHQTRATYGTWLMQLALSVTTEANALALVKGAMLHKDEATTFRYIRFLGMSKGKAEAAAAFTKVFTGLAGRDWNQLHA